MASPDFEKQYSAEQPIWKKIPGAPAVGIAFVSSLVTHGSHILTSQTSIYNAKRISESAAIQEKLKIAIKDLPENQECNEAVASCEQAISKNKPQSCTNAGINNPLETFSSLKNLHKHPVPFISFSTANTYICAAETGQAITKCLEAKLSCNQKKKIKK